MSLRRREPRWRAADGPGPGTRRDGHGGHPIGWLRCLLALNIGLSTSSLVGVSAAAAGEAWLVWLLDVNEGSLGFLLFVALMVVFPDGAWRSCGPSRTVPPRQGPARPRR